MEVNQLRDLQRQLAKLNASVNKFAGTNESVLFSDFARRYMADKLNNPTLRINTKKSFGHHTANHLIPAFGHLPLEKLNNAEWLRWVTATREKPGAITRFFNARKTLTEIMHAAHNDGLIERMPKFDNPDEAKNVGRTLSNLEVYRILKNTKSKFFRFIFYTFFKMGCRPREILKWEFSMIEFNEPGKTWINIPARISKTDRNRRIPINPSVSKRLFKMLKENPNARFVFPHQQDPDQPQLSYHGAWRTACEKAGVENAVVYDFRRTFITRCAVEGKPLLFVAKALDTSSKMIESVYAKGQPDVMEAIIR